MADFLDNLLLRSAGDQSAVAILRPRLPSLFEPLHGEDEIPIPTPDPVVRENFIPRSEAPTTVAPNGELTTSPSTITVENRAPSVLKSADQSPALHQKAVEPTQKPGREVSVPTRSLEPVHSLEALQHTIFPRHAQETSVKFIPVAQENHSLIHENKKSPQVESRPLSLGKIEQSLFPVEMVDNPLQTKIKSVGEYSLVERAAQPKTEAVPRLKPATLLQPMLPASLPAGTQKFKPLQEQQRVVEIHVGRIEVRAAPPVTPVSRASQKSKIMSLEEYLHARSEDRR